PAFDPSIDWFEGVRGGGVRAQRALLRRSRALRGAYFTYSPQSASSALNPGRTIGRQLQLAMARRAEPPTDSGAEIISLLAEVGLGPEVVTSLPGELSGGMCQRAALAIAVAPKPQLVIADEPETGLDPVLRRAVVELLVGVCRDHGAGLLLISHNHDTVDRIADTVVTLPDPGERA
ncbi:MAG: peptide/nickel transport system ATP-binding protein, partial [Myxococcota bacterium]